MACVLVPMTPIVVTHPGEWPVHEGHKPIGLFNKFGGAACQPGSQEILEIREIR